MANIAITIRCDCGSDLEEVDKEYETSAIIVKPCADCISAARDEGKDSVIIPDDYRGVAH